MLKFISRGQKGPRLRQQPPLLASKGSGQGLFKDGLR